MPRKAKEKINELNNIKDKVQTVKTVGTTSKSKSTTKSKSVSKTSSTPSKKTTSTSQKKKTNTVNNKVKKKTASTVNKIKPTTTSVISTEYYDLPFRYNQTVVKILAQTPHTLFIYWDISDKDRNHYVERYGKDFFNHTRPYLIITNKTKNYSFEVEINDFANSWYLHITDADCEYNVELCRKFIVNSDVHNLSDNNSKNIYEPYHINDYLYITSSNKIEMPNNHILLEQLGDSVFFRNTKTNILEEKNISSISFLQKIGKVYNIYDLYKEIYNDEIISDEFGLNLPSSNSSAFK